MKWKFSAQLLANLWQMPHDCLKQSTEMQQAQSPSFKMCKGATGTTPAVDLWADILCHVVSFSPHLFQGLVSRKGLCWLKGRRTQDLNEPPESPKQAIASCNPFKIFTSPVLKFVQLPVSIIPTDAFPHSPNSQHTFAQSHLLSCQDGHSAYIALLYPGRPALDYAWRTLVSSSWSSHSWVEKKTNCLGLHT